MPEAAGGRRLVALDLDGTLLDSNKHLTKRNLAALQRAADAGWYIVPSTGRFADGMPAFIRDLPFVRYVITINGAQVFDRETGESIYRAEIPGEKARRVMAFLDRYPVIYDCYKDNWGWMTAEMHAKGDEFAPDEHYRIMIRDLRKPVPELKEFIRTRGGDVQKIQVFAKDGSARDALEPELAAQFPELALSHSLPNNIEINHPDANKGQALLALAARLGVPREATIAFGDGTNDLSMIRSAGLGVAMKNAAPEVLAAAREITLSCDEDGVAAALERELEKAGR